MGANLNSDQGSRGRRSLNAEINVTPFVDVMLVLLVVFIIAAPRLQPGIEVDLPNASAEPLSAPSNQPLEITLQASGQLFIQQTEVERENLIETLNAITGSGFDAPIYFRADTSVDFGEAVEIWGRIRRAGYTKLSILTDIKRDEE